jgi:hypothetical protein
MSNKVQLHGSVGRKGTNQLADVLAVQILLNKFVVPGRLKVPILVQDGQCGPKSIKAIEAFQRQVMGMSKTDGKVDPHGATLKALNGPLDPPSPTTGRSSAPPRPTTGAITFDRTRIIDLTNEQDGRALRELRKVRVVRGRIQERDPAAIDGICFHQTAVAFGVSTAQIKASGGDRELALHRRALRVGCHLMAFRSGKAVHSAPWRWYVHHGHGLNARSIGIETDGLYAGVEGNPRTVWQGKTPTALTEETIEAARAAFAYTVENARAAGCPIRWVWAHRQSSIKRADPGSALWRHVVLDYAVRVLGLETQPDATWGKGKPIPTEWDPSRGVGRY